jgi:hypothetical protein
MLSLDRSRLFLLPSGMLCNIVIHVRKAEVELDHCIITAVSIILQLPMQGSWLTEARAWVTKL